MLEASFVVTRLVAWHRTVRKQLVRARKLHFLDTGLAANLLGITSPEQLTYHPLRGALFESWVVSELVQTTTQQGRFDRFFHYRDAKQLEVDLVVESPEAISLVEAKSGATVAGEFFDALRKLGDATNEPSKLVLRWVVYGGDAEQRRTDCTVLPWREVARALSSQHG